MTKKYIVMSLDHFKSLPGITCPWLDARLPHKYVSIHENDWLVFEGENPYTNEIVGLFPDRVIAERVAEALEAVQPNFSQTFEVTGDD